MTACHENSTELVLNVCDIAISNIDSDSASHTSFVILPVVPFYGSLSTITDILQSCQIQYCGLTICHFYHCLLGDTSTKKKVRASSAGSATVRDISWAKLITELTGWNLPDSQLHLESNRGKSTELQRHRTTGRGGDTAQKKMYTGRGDTAHTFLIVLEIKLLNMIC